MAYQLTGSCSQCGQCCKASFINKRKMCLKNNVIDEELYCDFIEKRADGKFYCSMIVERLRVDSTLTISKELDVELITSDIKTKIGMSDEQAIWCCRNMHFPDPNVERWRKVLDDKEKYGVPNCTFSYEVS